jgi:hypothetical protein
VLNQNPQGTDWLLKDRWAKPQVTWAGMAIPGRNLDPVGFPGLLQVVRYLFTKIASDLGNCIMPRIIELKVGLTHLLVPLPGTRECDAPRVVVRRLMTMAVPPL